MEGLEDICSCRRFEEPGWVNKAGRTRGQRNIIAFHVGMKIETSLGGVVLLFLSPFDKGEGIVKDPVTGVRYRLRKSARRNGRRAEARLIPIPRIRHD